MPFCLFQHEKIHQTRYQFNNLNLCYKQNLFVLVKFWNSTCTCTRWLLLWQTFCIFLYTQLTCRLFNFFRYSKHLVFGDIGNRKWQVAHYCVQFFLSSCVYEKIYLLTSKYNKFQTRTEKNVEDYPCNEKHMNTRVSTLN